DMATRADIRTVAVPRTVAGRHGAATGLAPARVDATVSEVGPAGPVRRDATPDATGHAGAQGRNAAAGDDGRTQRCQASAVPIHALGDGTHDTSVGAPHAIRHGAIVRRFTSLRRSAGRR